MTKPFYLLYFIHDDLSSEFELNTLPNILAAQGTKYTKIFLLHNKRFVRVNKAGNDFVYYETVVSKVVKNGNVGNKFKKIHQSFLWEDAFEYVYNNLTNRKESSIGLITLSHAAGIVINRNKDDKPILTPPRKIRDFIKKSKPVNRSLNTTYFEQKSSDDKTYMCTKTITGKVNLNNVLTQDNNQFEAKFTRTSLQPFCKHYEGLFMYQLTSFFVRKKIKFGFIIFSNCYVQLFDNAYLLSPVTQYMLSAESESDRTFWDFPTIVKTVNERENGALEKLVKTIFENCKTAFTVIDNTLHYFLCNLQPFKKLDDCFEQILEIILKQLKTDQQFKLDLQNWLPTAKTVTNTNMPFFDTAFFFGFANSISNIKFGNEIAAYNQTLKNEIVLDSRSLMPDFCGFALYLPRTREEFATLNGAACNYFNTGDKNLFVLHSVYDELITALFS